MSMTYYAVTNDPNDLAHFGIPGMKWGVRHDRPRHSGSRSRRRSAAYKKASGKLGKLMKSGIRKAEASWRTYNSPAAREERFMNKAMQKARNGTLKYGKLSDDQVRRVTERLALERNARQLGNTENPSYLRRLGSAFGEGIIRGVGQGTGSYIDERMRGRGRVTAEIKGEQRKAKWEASRRGQRTIRREAKNEVKKEYYEEAAKRGYNPVVSALKAGRRPAIQTTAEQARQLQAWKDRDEAEAEVKKRRTAFYDTYDKTAAAIRAKNNIPNTSEPKKDKKEKKKDKKNDGNGQNNPQLPVNINIYTANGQRELRRAIYKQRAADSSRSVSTNGAGARVRRKAQKGGTRYN